MNHENTRFVRDDYRLPDPSAYPYRMLPGKLAVAMDPPYEQIGELLMPECYTDEFGDVRNQRNRPDTGTVVGSGVSEVPVGARVIVKPDGGLYLPDPVRGPQDWVRMFGVPVQREDWEISEGIEYEDRWHDWIEAVIA